MSSTEDCNMSYLDGVCHLICNPLQGVHRLYGVGRLWSLPRFQ